MKTDDLDEYRFDVPEEFKPRVIFCLKFIDPAITCDNWFLKILLSSDYAWRHSHILLTLYFSNYQKPLQFEDYFVELKTIQASSNISIFSKELREFRHRFLLRLLIREASGLALIEETMKSWSDFADAAILKTIDFCKHFLEKQYGLPLDENGAFSELYVLAMGKLGGRELNFSSDIDLIFTFRESGYTGGIERISNQEFYIKLIKLFIQILQTLTPEGFVFRVDLRLRPHGESGPLALSLKNLETYYQELGRNWERYAMIKARIIGEEENGINPWYFRIIRPFVYRRYVDFSVIESLRSMKSLIEREVAMNPSLDDIKRGLGGIREIEFIVQNIQLIRGGRIPELQEQNTLKTLGLLKKKKLLSHTDALKSAYLFLRKLENILQSQNDQQTHKLPSDSMRCYQVALAMNVEWEKLLMKLRQYQRIVTTVFKSILMPFDPYEDEKRVLKNQILNVWQGHVETSMAINLFKSLNYEEPQRCFLLIQSFHDSPRCKRLTQVSSLRLDRFMVLLLLKLSGCKKTDKILLSIIHLLEKIVGRSAYLALLTENPSVLNELLDLLAISPYITNLLIQQPFLLEVLLDEPLNKPLPSKSELKNKLKAQLLHCLEMDEQNDTLRQFKLTHWLLAARSDVLCGTDPLKIGIFLSNVTQVIVQQVLLLATNKLIKKDPIYKSLVSRFAIIAYGKLGSRELTYQSDLDLVFIHEVNHQEEAFIIRLSQLLLNMLTTRSQAGVLFTVDTRLRPSGEAGLLVTSMEAFIDYQSRYAWVWEHQALIRARVLVGSKKIQKSFIQLKGHLLDRKKDFLHIRNEILWMRKKLFISKGLNEIKNNPGGLLDIEFLVQFLLLTQGDAEFKELTNTMLLLKKLNSKKIISTSQYHILKKADEYYHFLLHKQILFSHDEIVDPSIQSSVLAVCEEIYGLGNSSDLSP